MGILDCFVPTKEIGVFHKNVAIRNLMTLRKLVITDGQSLTKSGGKDRGTGSSYTDQQKNEQRMTERTTKQICLLLYLPISK